MASADAAFAHFWDQGSFAVNNNNWSKHNIPKSKRLESKYLHRINLGDIHDNHGSKLKMSQSMKQNIDRTQTKTHETRRIRKKDKKDRATTEMVLDHRTKTILYQMLSKGLIDNIFGCISTGKEANVYYCNTNANTQLLAIKVYKTSILKFRDRARYIRGEHRFDKGFSKNPRKMVQLWAEKEFRNLHRIHAAKIPSPKPIYVRQNVLLMTLIGGDGVAAPRLKDYKFTNIDDIYSCYGLIVKYMRLMYWKCNLIHADLSEYNILYFNQLPYIIDVSQSVEPAHPNSYVFLAMDCKNVNDYFRRKNGIMTLSDLELFEYVLDERHLTNNEKVIDAKLLRKIENICRERWDKMINVNEEKEVSDCIDLKSKIMTSLFDIDDTFQIHQNKDKFKQVSKFLLKGSGEMISVNKLNENESEDNDESSEDDEGNEEEEEVNTKNNKKDMITMYPESPGDALYHKNTMTKMELKEIRKANKKIVKKTNRERRKHKMPKKVKKRKIKVARLKAGKSVWK